MQSLHCIASDTLSQPLHPGCGTAVTGSFAFPSVTLGKPHFPSTKHFTHDIVSQKKALNYSGIRYKWQELLELMTISFLLHHDCFHVIQAPNCIGKQAQPKPVPTCTTVKIRRISSKSLGQYPWKGQSTAGRIGSSDVWALQTHKRQKWQTRATLSAAT